MAIAPWFVCGPAALLAALGHRRGPEPTVPTPAEDWRRAVVDVVIPVCRDQRTIIHCLTSLLRQTRQPRRVLLVDDGGVSRDHAVQLAREFARANGIQLQVVVRTWSVGKAVTVKRQARQFDGDVLFVLDANTVLASPDYLERCVRELYQGVGIASACGTVEPLHPEQRQAIAAREPFRRWLGEDEWSDPLVPDGSLERVWRWLGDSYRAHVGRLQQGFLDTGLMCLCGGVDVPAGEAIAYRRRYLKDMFDRYEPVRGDDLTAVEDIFIARALATEGYRSIRLVDVTAQVQYPEWQHLPQQAWSWTTALLQNDLYLDPLLRTPLTVVRHRLRQWLLRRQPDRQRPRGPDQRTIREAYRQPFGERLTRYQGRPIGTGLLVMALERTGYPVALLVLALGGWWQVLGWVVAVEVLLTLLVSVRLAPPGRRAVALLQAVIASPVRYALLLLEPPAMLWFAGRRWLARQHRWYARRESDGDRRDARRSLRH